CERTIGHAILVADLALLLHAQDLIVVDARERGEGRTGLRRRDREALVVGGQIDLADERVGRLDRRDPGELELLHQPLLQGLERPLRAPKFRWRRPRHTLKGRQTESEVERVGLRLQLRKQQAEAGDIVLLYGDESEALTHPYLARALAKSGADLRVPAPGQAKKVAMLGSLDHLTRQLIVHTSPTKRSSDFIAHLEQLDRLYGPQPGRQAKPA